MLWYESKPKPDFEDTKCEKTISWIESLSAFGILLQKRDSHLRLYLGVTEGEAHHVTTIPDISSVLCDVPTYVNCDSADDDDDVDANNSDSNSNSNSNDNTNNTNPDNHDRLTEFQLKHHYIYPLCTAVKPSKIYQQSLVLDDYTFGIIANRVDSRTIQRRSKTFVKKLTEKSKNTSQDDMLKSIKSKLGQDVFFAARVFFSSPNDAKSMLSSINFTNRLAEPNGLVPKGQIKLPDILDTPPKMSWWCKRQPVLTIPELVSILSFPTTMFGLDMRSGSDKTFSNIHSNTQDPVDYFSRLWERDR